MAGFIKNYISRLKVSDEKTKHRSALTIAIVTSVIILSIAFFLWKDALFFPNKNKVEEDAKVKVVISETDKVESPLKAFLNFFRESSNQLKRATSAFSDLPEALKEGVATSTETESSQIIENSSSTSLEATSSQNTLTN